MHHPDYQEHPEFCYSHDIEYWIAYSRRDDNRRLADRVADGIFKHEYDVAAGIGGLYDGAAFDFYRIPKAVFDMHVAFSTHPVKDQSEYYACT